MGIFSWLTKGAEEKKAAIHYLEQIAIEVTLTNVLPPKGEMDQARKEFLPRLNEARKRAAKFRQDFLGNAERQAAAQGFPGVIAKITRDPVDLPAVGWFSLGILFEYEKMDSSYGIQAFQALFSRVDPKSLKDMVIAHFGDLIQFDTFCAIMLKTQSPKDLAYIASRFGPDFYSVGLAPHSIRFLRANQSDGNLIARIFSLPVVAELSNGNVRPDPKAGVNWIMEGAVKGTNWKKG